MWLFFGTLCRGALVVLLTFLLYFDSSRLPTPDYVAGEMCNMLERHAECSSCQKLLSHFDVDGKGDESPIWQTLRRLDKPRMPAVQPCDGKTRSVECNRFLENSLIEKWSMVSALVHEMKKFYATTDPDAVGIVNTRHDELVEFILNEREARESEQRELQKWEDCSSIVDVKSDTSELSTNKLRRHTYESSACSISFSNDRQRSFCWCHCAGKLPFMERTRIWLLHIYLSYDMRMKIIILQHQRNTLFCLLLELCLLGIVMRHQTVEAAVEVAGAVHPTNGKLSNELTDVFMSQVHTGKSTTRRVAPPRLRGSSHRKD
ncbi:T. brucei spp.-specific protein [Trypanosoma brucei gambiense DAL972]|uniref:T. brucei spp.-specific protein n=2 Tax=Trypanosoma brucei gambiense (strain MHOM/CI/86/DAL972) TaxID=679716 RepID=D0A8V3_TRYB9|nr:T. brucei spp.-specific protein [Trypanosoma brucei gambiense DAL972]CBH18104.1 T. brucei spp.-specific protein [Trypanosoma brucei gambiense DAL972]|eukprot:XP_011780368.1 T. brucei spp.-specific protein [Trypanosoma brucei gambiense DAL972]